MILLAFSGWHNNSKSCKFFDFEQHMHFPYHVPPHIHTPVYIMGMVLDLYELIEMYLGASLLAMYTITHNVCFI